MEDITRQALDMVFTSELKSKVKKEATPYVAGVAVFNIVLLVCLIFLIFQVSGLHRKLHTMMATP